MRKSEDLFKLFVEELEDMLSCESQIIDSLPNLIKLASSNQLKEALNSHLGETKNQFKRIKEIFNILGIEPRKKECIGMKGILKEGDEMMKGQSKAPILDVTLISAAQKVEHYEIASYGTLKSFAEHLNLSSEIIDLIEENLNEEGAADKKLTKIAEGSIFTDGVNKEAAEELHKEKAHKK